MTEHILHTAKLNNNCPTCYTTAGLEITFAQNVTETRFHSKAEKTIIETIYCHTCKNVIYPVNWTDDLERIYEYHKKQVVPKKSFLKVKPIVYLLILVAIIIVTGIIYIQDNV